MKTAASPRGAYYKLQAGTAAVELSIIISATMVLLPAVALFAKVFFQYNVIKEATRVAATYMASMPVAAIKDETERDRAIAIAERMVEEAAIGAGLSGSTSVTTAKVECDGYECMGPVPDVFIVKTSLLINDELFAGLTGSWTDEDSTWLVGAQTTVPFSK
jgi:hypothetical protein